MVSNRPRTLLHAFSTFRLGGPQARFVQLANALGPGYEHHVVAMDNRFDAGSRLAAQVRWQPVEMDVRKGGLLANRSRCRQQLQQLQPDLLLTYNWGAIEWAAANLPRAVAQVHVEDGFGPEEAQTQLARRVWTRRVVLGWGRVPVVVASRRLEAIACDVWRLPAARVRHIPNGVAMPARTVRPATGRCLCIGTVAGLRPEKNLARLVRAFARLRAEQPARLVLVGEGALRGALQELAQSLQVAQDVEFTGYLEDPAPRLAELDLFALSSDTEQLPIALLEAMASGLPVVATRVGDVGAVLADVSPENVCAPDDEAFFHTLRTAVAQRDRWPVWSERGRAVVQAHYAEAGMLAAWQAVFDGRCFAPETPH